MTKSKEKNRATLTNCFLVGICFFLSSVAAFGQEAQSVVPKHTFEIGLNMGYLEYEEVTDVEWDGFMCGLIWSYTYHNKVMLNTSLEYTYGVLEYDGRTQGGTPVEEDADDWILEWRGLVGHDFTSNGHLITPFVGIGYRYWNDDVEGYGSYERETQYLYSPIGIKTVSPLSGTWTWGIAAEYDVFLSGKVTSHFSDISAAYNDPETDQDSGYGLKLSLTFSNQDGLSIQPYIAYWNIDRSDLATLTQFGTPIAYVYEPENETTSYGVRISWQF